MTYLNGGDRNEVRLVVYDVIANIPVAGIAGRLFIATDTDSIYWDTGAAWNLIAGGGAVARVPRTLFQHAHKRDDAEFPPNTLDSVHPIVIHHLPHNWNGTAKINLWLYGLETAGVVYTVIANAGTDGEIYTFHNQTVGGIGVTKTNNEYEVVDLTVLFAVWIALINPDDLLWFDITEGAGINDLVMGIEIQET